VVVSPLAYNERAGLCVACPITSRAKGFLFEVPIPEGYGVSGVVLADHVRCLSWIERRAEVRGAAPPGVLEDVRERIAALIEID